MNQNQDQETHWLNSDPRFEKDSEPEILSCYICGEIIDIDCETYINGQNICPDCIEEYRQSMIN